MKNLKTSLFTFLLVLLAHSSPLLAQTLCSQYGSNLPAFTIGAGTPYPNSSSLGSSIPSGVTVHIVGDFTVDNNFSLSYITVKVNTGVKISIATDYVYYNSNSLVLNNTKIFCCSGLWKGIEMNSITVIDVNNNSIIEDAENAIKAVNTSFASLAISNSTFNRNVVGINLEDSGTGGWFVVPPMIQYFVDNKFTCTSPLNGTSGDYTDIGVRMKNINYPFTYNSGNSNNEFRDLDNGMIIHGIGYTVANMDYYRFIKIKDKCIEFFNGDDLLVTNSSFLDIDKFGIDFSSSRILTAQNNRFTIITRDQAPEGFGRFGIYVQNPKINNTFSVQNNEFYFDGKLRLLSRGIEIFSNGGETEVMNANISGNSFKQYNDFGTSTDPGIRYSIGINLPGNYVSGSAVNIEGNAFILDANNTGLYAANTGVSARFGSKNNVKIIANTFKSGSGGFSEFVGSTGTGNEFTDNHAIQGGYNRLGGFLFLDNCENMKVCSNVDNVTSDVTYLFRGQSLFTDFTNNTTYGKYQHSLWITVNGVIGTQTHKGNKWYPAYDQWGSYTHPFLQHNDPFYARFSQFTVHTDQSVRTGNNYSFFSEYFPSDITPNNGDFFTKETASPPSNSCITQSPMATNADPVVDPAIADGSYSRLMVNPVIGFDGQLHLQRKLKKNKNLENAHKSIKEFSQKHEFSNIGKFVNLESSINDNQGMDDIRQNKVKVLRKKIEDIDKQMKQHDAQKKPTLDEIKQYYKQRLELDIEIGNLYKEHKNEKKTKLKTVRADADNIMPTTGYERYFKEVHQIYLDAQLNTDGQYTIEQIARLKKIAGTCVTEGGKIVYVARGFLSQRDLDEALKSVEECEKRPEVSQANLAENTQPLKNTVSNLKETVKLYPNPTGETFYIDIPRDLTAKAEIYDITGRMVKTLNLNTGSNFVKHEGAEGIYIAKVTTSDGITESIKFTIKSK